MRTIILTLVAALAVATAQEKQKTPKDEAEAKLINQVASEKDPNKILAGLDEWVQKYPNSDWKDGWPMMYVNVYEQAGKLHEGFAKANEILAGKPDDFQASTAALRIGAQIKDPSPAELDMLEKDADMVMRDADKIFAESSKPQGVTDANWAKVKPYWVPQARVIMITTFKARRDDAVLESKLKEKAAEFPNDPNFDIELAKLYLTQIKGNPQKQPLVLFYYARAAQTEGPDAAPAAQKQQFMAFFNKNYKLYHGSDGGASDVLAAAKANPVAPGDFRIDSTVDIAKQQEAAQAAADAKDPAMAKWRVLKEGLTGDTAAAFADSAKDAEFPGKDDAGNALTWKAKIVKLTPPNRPKTLVVSVQNPEGDVTLNVSDGPLPGKMEAGEEIQIDGVFKSFTPSPYMVTLEVTKDQIQGWTGKNLPTPKKTGAKKSQ
jgi:hypothetical protein